ncbi:MAG: hypothetical protein QXP39_00550 [Candidatus Aenigmatarchaeota archaeon]
MASFFLKSELFSEIPGLVRYTDIGQFQKIAVDPSLPYVNKLIEYPVLTGLFIHVMGQLGGEKWYLILSLTVLSVFAIITSFVLYKIAILKKIDKKYLIIFWVLAPSFIWFLFYNWDIIAVMFTAIALYLSERKKFTCASVFLSLGFCAKFFPILFLLPLFLGKSRNHIFKILITFISVFLAINLGFMIINFSGWWNIFNFHFSRGPNPDSIWFIPIALSPVNRNIISILTFSFIGIFYFLILIKYRFVSYAKLCFLLLLIFILFNSVFSPQYLLWLLPFYVLFRPSLKFFYSLEIVNIAILFFITYHYTFYKQIGFYFGNYVWSVFFIASFILVILRHIILAIILKMNLPR